MTEHETPQNVTNPQVSYHHTKDGMVTQLLCTYKGKPSCSRMAGQLTVQEATRQLVNSHVFNKTERNRK